MHAGYPSRYVVFHTVTVFRYSYSMLSVDGPITSGLWWLLEMTLSMVAKFGAVVFYTPIFFGPGVLVAVLGGWLGQIYIKVKMSC